MFTKKMFEQVLGAMPKKRGVALFDKCDVEVINGICGDNMRMLGYLKKPYICNKKDAVYKIVLHITEGEVYVYLYTSLNAIFSSFDNWYPDEESALEDWQGEIDERGWIMIDDPMPHCQHDALLPIRIKGRDTNTPQWGKFEIYQDGEWKDYKP